MTILENAAELLGKVREQVPLVHNITNYVTVNDCANALLAIGGSPIMADDIAEAADITAISSALVLNMGTLNARTIQSMLEAGKKANELGIPVVFDPVGAGASALRNETAERILSQVKIAVLRGNLSEISFAAGLEVSPKGVDSSEADSNNDAAVVGRRAAEKYHCVAAVTGAVDVITDGKRVVRISNGHRMLSRVTGTGCMTSAITGAFAAAASREEHPDYLAAAAGSVASMGMAGELAYKKAGKTSTGSFHIAVIDALSCLDTEKMKEMGRFEEE